MPIIWRWQAKYIVVRVIHRALIGIICYVLRGQAWPVGAVHSMVIVKVISYLQRDAHVMMYMNVWIKVPWRDTSRPTRYTLDEGPYNYHGIIIISVPPLH